MDIAEFLNSLNSKIATLESTDVEQKKRIAELEDQLQRQNDEGLAQIQSLRQELEDEIDSHSFTQLQLEDALDNVETSVKLLRGMQQQPGDVASLHTTLKEQETTIAKLQAELSSEREARAQAEAKMAKMATKTDLEKSKRRALNGMVSALSSQLKHNQQQVHSYLDIMKGQKTELERKFIALDELSSFKASLSEPQNSDKPSPSTDSELSTKDLYLEELDLRFGTVLEMIEDGEGQLLHAEAASALKSALRDTKQVIGEEIIIAHSSKDLEALIGKSTKQLLDQERSTNAHLMHIIAELQQQLSSYASVDSDPTTFTLSFISAGAMGGGE